MVNTGKRKMMHPLTPFTFSPSPVYSRLNKSTRDFVLSDVFQPTIITIESGVQTTDNLRTFSTNPFSIYKKLKKTSRSKDNGHEFMKKYRFRT